MDEDGHGIPAALGPRVTTSTPCSVRNTAPAQLPSPDRFPTIAVCSHPCWLWPRRHPKEQHLTQRPRMIR